MHHVTDALRPYWPLIAAVILWPIVTGALNWWLWWDTAEHWDAFVARQPRAAFAVRFLRAAGPHLRKLVVAWRDYAASRSALPLATPEAPAAGPRPMVVPAAAPRETMAPPAPIAPSPLRAVTLTGVAAADATQAQYESARAFVAGAAGFDPARTQDVTHAAATARAILDPAPPANDREGE